MSIAKALKNYSDSVVLRWHTPGHKGKLNSFDITELGLDGEYFPSNLIEKAQRETAEFYGSKYCRYLVGGSSMGIKSFMLSVNGDVIAPKFAHRSIKEGSCLAKNDIFFIDTGIGQDGLPNVLTKEMVKKAIAQNKSAVAVFVESPDYFGRVVSKDVIEEIKKSGLMFYCDQAHGAHFSACENLFPQSYSSLADACNMSAHKTLFAYTQTAYLCVNNDTLIKEIDKALINLGTTSPNYMFYSSLQDATKKAKNGKAEYERLYKDIADFKKEIICGKNDDFTRLLIDAKSYGLSSQELSERLQHKGVYTELAKGDYVVAIATPEDGKKEFKIFAELIKEAIKKR